MSTAVEPDFDPDDEDETVEEKPKASPTLQELIEQGHAVEAAIQKLAEDSDETESLTAHDVLESITDSVSFFSKLNELTAVANKLGSKQEDRAVDDAGHIAALVALGVNNKGSRANDREKQFLRVYAAAHNKKILFPGWFNPIQSALNVNVDSKDIPEAESYAEAAPDDKDLQTLAGECRKLKQKHNELRQKKDDGEGLVGPGGDETLRTLRELEAKRRELIQGVIPLKIDPAKVPACTDKVSFDLTPNVETIDALVSYYQDVGKLIVALTQDDDESTPAEIRLSKIVPGLETGARTQLKDLEVIAFPALPSVSKDELRETLPQILEAYVSLRRVLMDTYILHERAPAPGDPASGAAHTGAGASMKRALGSIFPNNDNAVVTALMQIDDPSLKQSVRELLFSKVLYGERGNESLFIALKNSSVFLPEAMQAILEGDEASVAQLQQGSPEFQRFVDFGLSIKRTIEEGKHGALAELFDDALKRYTSDTENKHGHLEERMALLVGLVTVTEDPAVRSMLKAQLRNKSQIATLAEQIAKDISGTGSERGGFVETLRVAIERRFNPTLRDYWGQNKLKNAFSRAVKNHLLLLRNPKSWEGLDPKTVFENGHLLIGVPGVGKGHLVTCAANEFNLPVETVTREQLESSLLKDREKKGKGDKESGPDRLSESDLESAFANFLDERIEAAREKMRKLGSIASFFFIDEMEGEFLNRDPATGDRTELISTNVMLRVIEKKISENPDIIFIGATNYIKHVDPAAYRVGRFGIPWVIHMPEEEDVQEILDGNFAQLRIDNAQAKNSELYKKLVESCVGLTPLTISQLVNNHITVLRASGEQVPEQLTDEILAGLVKKADLLKERFAARDEVLTETKERQAGIEDGPGM